MTVPFIIKQGDTLPILALDLQYGVSVIDPTTGIAGEKQWSAVSIVGASVTFNMRFAGTDTTLISAPATITDAVNGSVSYSFSASDTAVTGQCEGEMEVTFADGNIETFPRGSYIKILILDSI